jgi:hypothetical protein
MTKVTRVVGTMLGVSLYLSRVWDDADGCQGGQGLALAFTWRNVSAFPRRRVQFECQELGSLRIQL